MGWISFYVAVFGLAVLLHLWEPQSVRGYRVMSALWCLVGGALFYAGFAVYQG